MKYIAIAAFLLSTICTGYSQNMIFIGDNSYPSTQAWYFEGNGSQFQYYANAATIQIGKKGTNGIFLISTTCYSSASGISGSINIYLNDGSRITLSSVIAKDFVDGESKVIYSISAENIKKLIKSDIQTIRFNTKSGSSLEGHTVSNKHDINHDPMIYEEGRWETSKEIKSLFDKDEP